MVAVESEWPSFDVLAELRLDLDGHQATLTGSGDDLLLVASDPSALLNQLATAAIPAGVGWIDGPRALGLAADTLGRAGLRLTVQGPQGTLVTLGRGQASLLGRLITGSERAQLGDIRSLVPLVRAKIAQRGRQRLPLIAAGAAGLGLVAITVRLLSRGNRSTTALR